MYENVRVPSLGFEHRTDGLTGDVTSLFQYPGLNEAGLKYQREQMVVNPKLSKGWIGPFTCMVQVSHPETVKVILKSSGTISLRICYGCFFLLYFIIISFYI